jgi:tetratricopeptide (TPR) repeat protein
VSKPDTSVRSGRLPRVHRGGRLLAALLAALSCGAAFAIPYIPADDHQVVAELPAGARHHSTATRDLARSRLDIALPMAQFYISRARATGDLRYLGYAEAILAPWLQRTPVAVPVRVLNATILQSRHAFAPALGELDRALAADPTNAQAWLTRATVLRVMGRYPEALDSCQRLAAAADPAITTLCTESIRSLSGHLQAAYAAVAALPQQSLPPEAQAWRYSELGEMAARLGDDEAAEHYLKAGLAVAANDFYLRGAYADVLLRHARATETLALLGGYESMEPMLLRIAIAHRMLGDGAGAQAGQLLANAFEVEQQRGEAVHRREQARFFLDVEPRPAQALAAAQENWQVQREPDDVLILLRAARAAGVPQAAQPARQFLQQQKTEDARFELLARAVP